jgi:hypothetical protein
MIKVEKATFKKLGHGSLLNQDQDEEGLQEQQHQELVAEEAITKEAGDDGGVQPDWRSRAPTPNTIGNQPYRCSYV